MSFEKCCNNSNFINYDIEHKPRPLVLSKEMTESLERLLWYIPNIPSKQSNPHELVGEKIYDDFCFDLILNYMGISQNDVLWFNGKENLSKEYYDFYKNRICTNCQKLLLRKGAGTKTVNFLRHLRNSIAHGNFNIYDDILIGFDENKNFITAIIKIRPRSLLNALKNLDSGITKERLFKNAFEKLGYEVLYPMGNVPRYDLIIKKDNRQYIVDIKICKTKYIKDDFIMQQMYYHKQIIGSDSELLLIIDTSYLTKKTKEKMKNNKIKILDIKLIKELLEGKDILLQL